MWLLFLSPHPEKNQTYDVFLWRRGGAWPRGLSWLSKQTYQEQVETGGHWCHIRPVLNQRKPQDMYLLRPGSCHTMPHACLIKWALGTAEWRAAGARGRAALLSMSRSFFFFSPALSDGSRNEEVNWRRLLSGFDFSLFFFFFFFFFLRGNAMRVRGV